MGVLFLPLYICKNKQTNKKNQKTNAQVLIQTSDFRVGKASFKHFLHWVNTVKFVESDIHF